MKVGDSMQLILDRFEGNFAICENILTGEMLNINKNLIPHNTKEGTVLTYVNGNIAVDEKGTQERTERIKVKMNSLWE